MRRAIKYPSQIFSPVLGKRGLGAYWGLGDWLSRIGKLLFRIRAAAGVGWWRCSGACSGGVPGCFWGCLGAVLVSVLGPMGHHGSRLPWSVPGQDAGEMLLNIEARIGELYEALPTNEGKVGRGKTSVAVAPTGKLKAVEEIGIASRKARDSAAIHRNPAAVAALRRRTPSSA